ncbi:MAG: Na+/H+ antiporter NhaA [Gammaproteobacteria bacterium]|nr:Na+/H+ antiporter NhaA [Gammaproteobacteria bacterium]MBU2675727.1 Na+/H+ antiporter NhaA [Gammaproteobacteria bacterium]NNL49465.1 Na+/H+ antiporter NhaA [Woeseiaceae bacterium]
MIDTFRDFLKLETASGILLVIAAVVAMVVANSPLSPLYDSLIDLPVGIRVGALEIEKPLLLWINDGLMAIFFFLVGLELKREVLEGQLSDPREIVLPALGALGGMLVPAAIYIWVNQGDNTALQGWAIPAATDIAFALAILALLGSRVPLSLKVFLVSVAIFDDVGAIAIIALFYTSDLSVAALVTAALCLPALLILNRRGVLERTPYIFIGIVMWVAVLKSGVHATLAGVILAVFIPLRDPEKESSPLHEMEHDLHTAVAFGILPIFAFVNAGIPLGGLSFDSFLHPVSLGIIAGLFFGKQLGVFFFCGLGVLLGIARLPDDLRWSHIYGTALLCGVGFTMSLFIGSLAFEETGVNLLFDERLGIIAGSLLSGLCGYFVLRMTLPPGAKTQ